jgi:hypothetical protein
VLIIDLVRIGVVSCHVRRDIWCPSQSGQAGRRSSPSIDRASRYIPVMGGGKGPEVLCGRFALPIASEELGISRQ